MRFNDPSLVTVNPAGYIAPAAISAAGNTDLILPTGPDLDDRFAFDGNTDKSRNMAVPQRPVWFYVSVLAGTGTFTGTLALNSANAIPGSQMDVLIAMPASTNPTIEIHNLTSGGALLATVAGLAAAMNYNARFRFDGTKWVLVSLLAQTISGFQGANLFLAGPASGGSGPSGYRAIVAADLPGLTGDVTAAAGSISTTIAAGVVTLSKMANLSALSIIGNNTGSAVTPLALTTAQVKTLLAIANTDVSGLGTLSVQNASAVAITGGSITGLSLPSVSSDVATKGYVDSVAQGLAVKPSARVATAAALPANTYANGTSGVGATLTGISTGVLTVDSYAVALGDFVLVKNEATGANNGLYKCTAAGAVGVAYVLTRDVNMDASMEFSGGFVFIEGGSVNISAGFVCTNTGAVTVGTTAIGFQQFSGAGEITAGTGLSQAGNVLSIDGTVVTLAGVQTLTNKTISPGQITGLVASATTDTTNASNISSGTLADGRLSSNVALRNVANTYTLTDSTINATSVVATFYHAHSSGTPTTNYGVGVDFYGDTSTVNNRQMGRLYFKWSTASDASRNSKFAVQTCHLGTLTDAFSIDTSGNATAVGTLSGTAVNSSGTSQAANFSANNYNGFQMGDFGASGNFLILANIDTYTANRTLTFSLGDSSRSFTLGGDLVTAANLATVGAFALTLTTTATTNVTLPTTGTLATLDGTETLTNKSIAAGQLTGTIAVARGGTNISSYTKGDILVASASTVLSKQGVGTDTMVLSADSSQTTGLRWISNAPSYGSQAANTFLIGPTSGGSGSPVFRAMVSADIPTTLTPQIANLGIGVASSSTAILKASLGSGYQLISATQGSNETSGVNLIDIATTWNNSGNTPAAFKLAVTDTASNTNSLFEDFKIATTSKWSVRKDGTLTVGIVPVARVTGLATVATSGAYSDLSGRPSLATVATSGAYSDLSGRPNIPGKIGIVMYIDSIGAGAAATAVDISGYGFSGTPLGVSNCNSDYTVHIQYDWDDSNAYTAYSNSDVSGTFRITVIVMQ